jgi:plastocyanin
MPNSTPITITKKSGKTVFTPDPVNLSPNDSVFWVNDDSSGDVKGAHQLGPADGSATDWMPFPVLPGEGGESNIVGFPNAGTYPYKCFVAGHQNETGTIIVQAPPAV